MSKPVDKVELSIVRVVRDVAPWGVAEKQICPEMSLENDLGIDSMGKLAIVLRLEEELGVDFGNFTGSFDDVRTVKHLLAITRELIEQ